jgi:flagellar protein FlgJ
VALAATLGAVAAPEAARASGALVAVSSGSVLNVRSGPSTAHAVVGTLPAGAGLSIECQTGGQAIAGLVRTTTMWDRLGDGTFVSDAFVSWQGSQPGVCGSGAVAQVASFLNERVNASTLVGPVGTVGVGAALDVSCQLGGDEVSGTVATTSMWDRLSNGRFVSDAFVSWPSGRPNVPWCSLSGGGVPESGEPFIAWAAPMAQDTFATYRVPASVTLAQAILESGWGRSALTVDGNSFFGMKCFGSPGTIAAGCRPYQTYECDAGCYSTNASFRVYLNAAASFRDHAAQLASMQRYANAFNYSANPDQFAIEVHRGGYATSPTYADDLIRLMRQYNLYRYDSNL